MPVWYLVRTHTGYIQSQDLTTMSTTPSHLLARRFTRRAAEDVRKRLSLLGCDSWLVPAGLVKGPND